MQQSNLTIVNSEPYSSQNQVRLIDLYQYGQGKKFLKAFRSEHKGPLNKHNQWKIKLQL